MADGITIKIKGIRALRKNLSRLRKSVNDETAKELEELVTDVEATAKRIVPRKTANLQRTITSEVEERARQGPIGVVGANTVYAKRLEDVRSGTKHRSRKGFIGRPTPYLIPALQSNLSKILKGIRKAIKLAIQGSKK